MGYHQQVIKVIISDNLQLARNERYECSQHSNIKLINLGVLGLGMAPGHWAILMICDYGSHGSRIKSDVAIGQKYTQHMSKAFFSHLCISMHQYLYHVEEDEHPCIPGILTHPKNVKDWQRLGVVHHESRRLRSVATGSPWSQELATWSDRVRCDSGCSLSIWNLNYWLVLRLSREFSGMIHGSSLVIIIPATPSNPSIPYV